MEHNFESLINAKITQIENELNNLKSIISTKKNKPVSLRGMAKLLVNEEELEKSIEEAKKSLFKGA
ncbi:hypothetical protein HYX00_05510 [Candidatus Woesearchaeota archaeon]|nr:hypothetical protein [Candidatus Woesearchaeota archaeon]